MLLLFLAKQNAFHPLHDTKTDKIPHTQQQKSDSAYCWVIYLSTKGDIKVTNVMIDLSHNQCLHLQCILCTAGHNSWRNRTTVTTPLNWTMMAWTSWATSTTKQIFPNMIWLMTTLVSVWNCSNNWLAVSWNDFWWRQIWPHLYAMMTQCGAKFPNSSTLKYHDGSRQKLWNYV